MTTTSSTSQVTRLGRKLALAAGALGLASSSLLAGTGQAHAASATTSGWNTYSSPIRCAGVGGGDDAIFWCLYYSPGAEGAVYKSGDAAHNSVWFDVFQDDGYGSAGTGQGTWHNAASVENPNTYCSVAVYSGTNYMGNQNWVPAMRGGNLSWWLRNQEESVQRAC
jgi:hypothetical protein